MDLNYAYAYDYESDETSQPTLPSAVMIKQVTSVASSCSSTSHTSSDSSSFNSANDMTIGCDSVATKTLVDRMPPASKTMAKLSLMLDELRVLARMGHNAQLKKKCSLPKNIAKSDIHVHVDFDERARGKTLTSTGGQRRLEESVKEAIRDDLQSVYSATEASAKLILCIVIVVMNDGSLSRALLDSEHVAGFAEIGLVWRLFGADDLKVYEGGLLVQTEDFEYSFLDLFQSTGRECLMEKLVPRVANNIATRLGESNEELFVEI